MALSFDEDTEPTAATSEAPVSIALVKSAEPPTVAVLRHAAADFAASHGADRQLQQDVALAVSEAVTNAVKHARAPDGKGIVELTASVAEEWLEIRVRDRGRSFGGEETDGLGLGLPIIGTLAPDLAVSQPGHGTELRMRFPLPRDEDRE